MNLDCFHGVFDLEETPFRRKGVDSSVILAPKNPKTNQNPEEASNWEMYADEGLGRRSRETNLVRNMLLYLLYRDL